MRHRGEIVEKAVNDSGISKTVLAKRLGKSRRHLYNMFENNKLDFDTIKTIGVIIHHNFSEDFPELNGHVSEQPQEGMITVAHQKALDELNACKDKYIELLEQYNSLLRGTQPKPEPKAPKEKKTGRKGKK